MRFLKLGILLSVVSTSLVACSSSSTDQPSAPPAADSPKMEKYNKEAPPEPAKPEPAPVKMIAVPAGTQFEVVLADAVSSAKSNAGDKFEATLAEPLVVGGATVLERAVTFHGHVVDAKGSARVKGLASLSLTLTDVVQDGKTTPIVTKHFFEEAQNTKKRDAGIIGGAAAIGTAIGAIAGGKKGAAEGAAVGGGAGTGTVLVTKGKEVELGPEAKIRFTLEKSVEIAAPKK